MSALWLYTLIDDCLNTFYQYGGDYPELRLKDDGSNLRFSHHSPQLAFINKWSFEGKSLPKANLSDSRVQIESIFSPESLKEYEQASPNNELTNDICKGRFILLSDFELVLEYTIPTAHVYLYVKGFSIVWDRGKENRPPQGKLVKNHPALLQLTRRVHQKVKSLSNQRAATFEDGDSTDDGLAAEVSKNHGSPSLHGIFLSQPNPNPSPKPPITQTKPKRITTSSRELSESMGNTQEYECLAANLSMGKITPPNAQPPNLESDGTDAKKSSRIVRASSKNEMKNPTSRSAQQPSPTIEPSRNVTLPDPPPQSKQGASTISGDDGPVNTTTRPNQERKKEAEQGRADTVVERAESMGNSDAQQRLPHESSTQNVIAHTDPRRYPDSRLVDAWNSRTKIQPREVTILRDQCEFLDENHRRVWVPVAPGETFMPGHIPYWVLDGWNRIASWKYGAGRENTSKDSKAKQLNSHGSQLDHESSASPSHSDSEGEPLTSNWSGSSSEYAFSPRRELPADSSPLRRPVDTEAAVPQVPSGEPERDLERNATNSKPINEKPSDVRPLSSGQRDSGNSLAVTLAVDDKRIDDETQSQWSTRSRGDQRNDDENESDVVESDESVMDISVPRPLFYNSPQVPSTEPEPPGRIAQVTETPTANPNRNCNAPPNANYYRSVAHSSEQLSSQAGKSSSQSRILNTYASHEGDSREDLSQTTSKSISTNGEGYSSQVHVTRTPAVSMALPAWDTTSSSGSGSAWKSSVPGNPGSSAPLAISTYQSQQSEPFSFYRDIALSSMLSIEDDQGPPDMCSPMTNTSVKLSSKAPLKRSASEIENIDKEESPSKRNKTNHALNEEIDEIDINKSIVARRQRYLSHSIEPSVFCEPYEKFQNDYPNYSGDIKHFAKLCAKLHQLRQEGSLKRSFLWDDFVIKHLEEYPRYLAQRSTGDGKSLEYEEYFSSSFSKPSYKKRSLTAHGISACAANYASKMQPPAVTPSDSVDRNKTSFTSSLRDKFSDLHAHSFETQDPPTENGIQAELEESDSIQLFSDSQSDRGTNQEDAVTEDLHETASIELGDDDTTIPTIRNHRFSMISSPDSSESESINENWFSALRHLSPAGPSWSDDPNTPFKVWARVDQNVLVERSLRGGTRMPEDKRGVIQPTNYKGQ